MDHQACVGMEPPPPHQMQGLILSQAGSLPGSRLGSGPYTSQSLTTGGQVYVNFEGQVNGTSHAWETSTPPGVMATNAPSLDKRTTPPAVRQEQSSSPSYQENNPSPIIGTGGPDMPLFQTTSTPTVMRRFCFPNQGSPAPPVQDPISSISALTYQPIQNVYQPNSCRMSSHINGPAAQEASVEDLIQQSLPPSQQENSQQRECLPNPDPFRHPLQSSHLPLPAPSSIQSQQKQSRSSEISNDVGSSMNSPSFKCATIGMMPPSPNQRSLSLLGESSPSSTYVHSGLLESGPPNVSMKEASVEANEDTESQHRNLFHAYIVDYLQKRGFHSAASALLHDAPDTLVLVGSDGEQKPFHNYLQKSQSHGLGNQDEINHDQGGGRGGGDHLTQTRTGSGSNDSRTSSSPQPSSYDSGGSEFSFSSTPRCGLHQQQGSRSLQNADHADTSITYSPASSLLENDVKDTRFHADRSTTITSSSSSSPPSSSASTLPPLAAAVQIDSPQGFLFEWWSVFWDVFRARAGKGGSEVAKGFVDASQNALEVTLAINNSKTPEHHMLKSIEEDKQVTGMEAKTVPAVLNSNPTPRATARFSYYSGSALPMGASSQMKAQTIDPGVQPNTPSRIALLASDVAGKLSHSMSQQRPQNPQLSKLSGIGMVQRQASLNRRGALSPAPLQIMPPPGVNMLSMDGGRCPSSGMKAGRANGSENMGKPTNVISCPFLGSPQPQNQPMQTLSDHSRQTRTEGFQQQRQLENLPHRQQQQLQQQQQQQQQLQQQHRQQQQGHQPQIQLQMQSPSSIHQQQGLIMQQEHQRQIIQQQNDHQRQQQQYHHHHQIRLERQQEQQPWQEFAIRKAQVAAAQQAHATTVAARAAHTSQHINGRTASRPASVVWEPIRRSALSMSSPLSVSSSNPSTFVAQSQQHPFSRIENAPMQPNLRQHSSLADEPGYGQPFPYTTASLRQPSNDSDDNAFQIRPSSPLLPTLPPSNIAGHRPTLTQIATPPQVQTPASHFGEDSPGLMQPPASCTDLQSHFPCVHSSLAGSKRKKEAREPREPKKPRAAKGTRARACSIASIKPAVTSAPSSTLNTSQQLVFHTPSTMVACDAPLLSSGLPYTAESPVAAVLRRTDGSPENPPFANHTLSRGTDAHAVSIPSLHSQRVLEAGSIAGGPSSSSLSSSVTPKILTEDLVDDGDVGNKGTPPKDKTGYEGNIVSIRHRLKDSIPSVGGKEMGGRWDELDVEGVELGAIAVETQEQTSDLASRGMASHSSQQDCNSYLPSHIPQSANSDMCSFDFSNYMDLPAFNDDFAAGIRTGNPDLNSDLEVLQYSQASQYDLRV